MKSKTSVSVRFLDVIPESFWLHLAEEEQTGKEDFECECEWL